jgi:acyl-CoA thioester hydrolase
MKKVFETEMKVRDYECDVQGIVNNANYLHYFENARHEFMESLGISFKKLHTRGVIPMVVRADVRYKTPLTGGDIFSLLLTVERRGARIVFYQTIHRKLDGVLCCQAQIEVAILIKKQISQGSYFDKKMKEYLR